MKLWGRANSTNVRKALWCAFELELTPEHIEVGGAFGGVDTPEYRAMNPNGLVPCLEDGALVLWESNTIVRYLARQYGAAPFTPDSAAAWAEAEKWMDWVSLAFAEPFKQLFWNQVRQTPETRDSEAMERGRLECARLMGIADDALATRAFLAGDTLTVADIPLGCLAYAWFSMPIERPELSHLAAWYARLSARPAFQRGVMTPLT
ncbi:glutathione S-transferase family protein [Larsenimonas salina]|uniref:glutathione S-transferase family protein n=1 Tax=Larsenimonas salina TaxID=1295565 RepID=UPI002073DB5A|nr:glutathione S-transferase [Larsenimonas salina]MCM5704510.1 glutathione S-transferase [Larsenimonas salina]